MGLPLFLAWKIHRTYSLRVPSRGFFWVLNPHQNHLDPYFIWPWVQWTLCIDLSQAGSDFSYGILKSLVCWWPHSSLVLYNVVRKYSICSRIKCQLETCAQHPASSEFVVTNENKITPQYTNILRMYLVNCCFGLNKNDDFWQLWVYYQLRAQYVEEPGMVIIER